MGVFGSGAPLVPTTMNIRWSTHGRAQGLAYQDGAFVRGAPVSSDDTATGQALFYRRPVDDEGEPTGDWEVVGSFSPGWTGRWQSPPAKEDGYIYGVKSTAASASPDSTGNFVTREYLYLLAWVPSGEKLYPAAWCEPVTGLCHIVYVQGEDVWYMQSDPWTQQGSFRGWRYGGLTPIKGTPQTIAVCTGGYTDPSIVVMDTREIIVSARASASPNAITLKRSLDQGATWEEVAVGTFVADLTQLALWQRDGVLHGAGITGGNAVYRRSDDGGVTAAPLDGDSPPATSATIVAAEDEQPAIVIDPTGTPYAVVNTGAALAVMVSKDGGNTWAQADTV